VSGAQIELQHKVHVLTKKEELDSVRVQGKVVIVLDVLFATTTMVAVLANGAREVVPVLDEAAARACALGFAGDGCVLAGELYAETLPGFAHPAPLALIEHGVRDKTVVYSTTNGTVAMTDAAGAARVYCGALLNAQRLVEHIVENHARETVLILCSGSGNNFNYEDFYGAGCFVDFFSDVMKNVDLSDAARASRDLYRRARLPQAFYECRVGAMMVKRGLRREVDYACQVNSLPVVAVLEEGRVRLVSDSAPGRSG
jgi:2-phosphosulfolactate phosphatase